jgi:hypothetical protein
MDKPRISADELAQKLVNSKKIMKKVNAGDYEKGNIDKNLLTDTPEGVINEGKQPQPTLKRSLGLPVGVPSVEKIRGSKLPDAIKTAMIENPIAVPDISLSDGLDIDVTNKARQLMERDGTIPVKYPSKSNTLNESRQVQTQQLPNDFESRLIPIIESAVRKVLNEKLIQILDAQNSTTINENLVIKVGDSLFTGKITKVKNTK